MPKHYKVNVLFLRNKNFKEEHVYYVNLVITDHV